MSRIDPCSDVREFFCERLQDAFEAQQTTTSKDTEAYLLNLLTGTAFADPETLDCPLVSLLEKAHQADGPTRVIHFQRLGDAALMLYGFFSDSIASRGVDESYVLTMGGTGYGSASMLMRRERTSRALNRAEVYRELSERFAELGSVVADVRDQTTRTERDVVRVYERWARTRSPRLARRLSRLGLFPTAPAHPSPEN